MTRTAAAPDETKARILAATDALVAEVGFDATSTRDIAERSGVNKALIHYHFGTKDDLLEVLLDGYYARLTAALVASLAGRATPEAQAEALLDAYADFLAQNRTFCSIVQREVASGHHVGKIVERTLPVFRLGATWLAPLASGARERRELVQLLTSVYGMVVTYFTYGRVLERLDGQDRFTPRALEERKAHVRRVVRLLLRDLRAGATPKRRGPRWERSTRRTPRTKRAS